MATMRPKDADLIMQTVETLSSLVWVGKVGTVCSDIFIRLAPYLESLQFTLDITLVEKRPKKMRLFRAR